MFCKKCRAKIDKKDLFCNKCGERVVDEVVNRKRCKQCGWEMDNNIFFCNNCGSRMLEEVITSDSSTDIKKVKLKNIFPKMTKKNVLIIIILVLVVCFVINIRNRNTLSGTYCEYDEETNQFYSDRMLLDFSRDGSVVIRDRDRVYQGNYRKENNLIYVSSPGVSGEPLQMRSKNELIYENYHNVQIFKKQNMRTTTKSDKTERKSVLNDGNTYLTYLDTYPCEYLPNLDGIYYGMPLDKAAEYLEEEGFEIGDEFLENRAELINISNTRWKGIGDDCGTVMWEETVEGSSLWGISVHTLNMERQTVENAYCILKEYYNDNFNGEITEETADNGDFMICDLGDGIFVQVVVQEDMKSPYGCEFTVIFHKEY